ncbi:MAG: efflux RND transporter periplasmic adaptor subunit, partial [Porphyromonas sp.]|nr:efflux RND transporter periplasmic adaptor subunit [Porphyromonas sp.]
LVKVGDRVGAGQAVARMEATQAAQAQIQLADAKTNFARMDELYKVGGVSKAQWEQAKSAVDQAKLAYGNAAENTVLRSPISGFVTAKNYDNGDMTSPQLPVVVIQQIAPVKAVIGVSEQYYSYLKKGAAATLSVDALGEETFSGIVTNIFPTLDPVTHTVSTEIEVANKDLKLRPGMYARVHLDFGTKEALTVPDKAIVRQAGSGARYVYVFSGGKAIYRAVELGQQQGDLYEVVSGLNAGDQVITSAPSNLKNGLSVKLRK